MVVYTRHIGTYTVRIADKTAQPHHGYHDGKPPGGIVVKDIENDFRYIYRNRESYNRDISAENAIGMNDFDYYPLEMAQQKRKEDMEIANTGKGMHWIMEGKDKMAIC